ncbi:hypothetical protein F9L07_19850 [Pimelobacter simplex]|uniref:Uncharacterized protein n=1 Tax=Nocardioides simplex TaxID=2045 RepID=A0A7J5DW57_NOCSI|nr:hypothetical protein [Pimelobacter simplex]KAB2809296.1 hypothetical protein F9L07_19850 [Pimelobacter simplex]
MDWFVSPGAKYGGSISKAQAGAARPTADATATASIQPAPRPSLGGLLSPHDPMFWFGVFATGTVVLMAYSTASLS